VLEDAEEAIVMEVSAVYPRIRRDTPADRHGLRETCDAASVRYSGFSIGERGSNFPIGLPCGVPLLIVRI
jgi:hypothetical protein